MKKILFCAIICSLLINVSLAGYSYDQLMYMLQEEDVYDPYCEVTFVCRNGLYGAIDKEGNQIIPAKYEYIEHDTFHNMNTSIVVLSECGTFPYNYVSGTVPENEAFKFSFIDLNTRKTITPQYDFITDTYCGKLVVTKNGKEGLIDLDNNIVIPIEYDLVNYYSDNNIIVSKNGKYGVLRRDGSVRIPLNYDYLSTYDEGQKAFATVKIDGKEGILDGNGNVILPLEFEDLRVKDNMAFVKKYGKWGVIDLDTLTYIMKPTYKAEDIYGWNARYMSLGSWGNMEDYPIVKDENVFSDLPINHWAYSAVESMQEKGKLSGFLDGTFRPDDYITREQFASVLVKTLNLMNDEVVSDKDSALMYEQTFEDVEVGRWSKLYIDYVSNYLDGTMIDGKNYFMPSEYAIREDVIVATVKAMGLDKETPDYSILNKFTDNNLISPDNRKYIAIALKNGIVSGNSNGTLNPKGVLTRAQIAAIMNNIDVEVVMPDVEGCNWEDVKELIEKNEIMVNVVTEYNSAVEKGIVVKQSLEKGTIFDKTKEIVYITVSK